jgi:hypothetical protein
MKKISFGLAFPPAIFNTRPDHPKGSLHFGSPQWQFHFVGDGALLLTLAISRFLVQYLLGRLRRLSGLEGRLMQRHPAARLASRVGRSHPEKKLPATPTSFVLRVRVGKNPISHQTSNECRKVQSSAVRVKSPKYE